MPETIKYVYGDTVIHEEVVPDGTATEDGPPRFPAQTVSIPFRIMTREGSKAFIYPVTRR